MATVKISQLPIITHLSANNANTIFVAVDKTTNTTGQFSTTTLAGALYEDNVLNVGTSQENLNPNVVAQFISNTAQYSQIWVQNINEKGSGDFVITSDNGDNSNNYIDLGIQGSAMAACNDFNLANNDGYLYVQGKSGSPNGNLWIGTGQANTDVVVFLGGTLRANEAARFNKDGLALKSKPLTFADATTQNTAAVSAAHSQVIFNQANSAYNFAIDLNNYVATIYNQANTHGNNITIIQGVNVTQNTEITAANVKSQAAFDLANTNSGNITIIQGVNTTQNTNITTANNHAWAAFDKANNALANTTGIFNGTLTITGDLNFDGTASIQATDDLFIGSVAGVQIQTDIDGVQKQFNFGEDGSLSVPVSITIANTEFNSAPMASPAVFMISTNYAFGIQANTQEFLFGSDGSFTTPGVIHATGGLHVNNSTFSTSVPLISITASDGFVTVPPSNTNYMLHVTGKANSVTRIVADSFGTNTYPLYTGRMGRGSAAIPAAVANNDVLLRFAGNGYTGTQFPASSPSKIDMVAAENFSDTNRGTRIEFWNTPRGSNTIQKIASFNADSVEFTGTIQPDKGFIYVPTIYEGAQTAITINFSTTSLIRATLTADLTFTLSNFVYGKVVEVWLTNTGGTQRTVTHGCSALNSTINSTTFTMPATSSAYLRYFSIDGDLANTFVTVQHA